MKILRIVAALVLLGAAPSVAQTTAAIEEAHGGTPLAVVPAEHGSRTASDYLKRALSRMEEGDKRGSLVEIKQALALEPDNPGLLLVEGMFLNAIGQPRDAVEPLRRAAELEPGDPQVHLEYGRAMMATEDLARSRDALAQFDEALRLKPDYPAAYVIKGELLAANHDRAGVVANYDAWLSYHPGDPEAYSSYAGALARLGDNEAALRMIDRAMAAPEPGARTFATRARLRLKAGDVTGARADIDAALEKRRNYSFLVLSAEIRERQGDSEGALADLQAALEDWPASLGALIARSDLYEKLGRYALAIQDIDRMLEIRPGYPSFLNQRCWVRAIANIDLDAALADCNASLAAKPNNGATLDSLGLVQLRRGNYQAAIAAYDAALASRPGLAESLYGRGMARIRAGAISAGREDLVAARNASSSVEGQFRSYGLTP